MSTDIISRQQRNDAVRFEIIEELAGPLEISLRTFFRQIGLSHVFSELIVPAIAAGNAFVNVALTERPWPPWGIGAQRVVAALLVHPIGDDDASLSNVFVTDDELTNIGLAAALFESTLQQLLRRGKMDVTYVVSERSVLADRVLTAGGFVRSDELFLTESLRYHVYLGEIRRVLERLGLADVYASDILAERLEDSVFDRNALFHATTQLAFRAYWNERSRTSEMIANTGIAVSASPPGGIGGTAGPKERDRELEIEEIQIEREVPAERERPAEREEKERERSQSAGSDEPVLARF
jgi:hypothetical protein